MYVFQYMRQFYCTAVRDYHTLSFCRQSTRLQVLRIPRSLRKVRASSVPLATNENYYCRLSLFMHLVTLSNTNSTNSLWQCCIGLAHLIDRLRTWKGGWRPIRFGVLERSSPCSGGEITVSLVVLQSWPHLQTIKSQIEVVSEHCSPMIWHYTFTCSIKMNPTFRIFIFDLGDIGLLLNCIFFTGLEATFGSEIWIIIKTRN